MACDDIPLDNPDPWIAAKPQATKGRGAVSNLAGRFETQVIETVDDGWQRLPEDSDISPELRTSVTPEYAKTILSRNQSPDLPFSVSLNPYRGCEHGCVYCFARPTHAYLGLSPGLDFETRLYAKLNAPELLRQALAVHHYQVSPIALGINTDAYQPCERELRLTRRCLEVLHECEHPVGVITKSALIERDIDLLQDMARNNLVAAALTITTLNHQVARTLEPRAASPTRRLQAMEKLARAGIPVLVSVAPVIPFITEQELENVLQAAASAGATAAGYTVLRLPWEVNPLFQEWLQTHFPERAQRVMNRIRDMRGGKDYQASFGSRMRGEGLWADLIRQRFAKALKRYGLDKSGNRAGELDCHRFRKPRHIPTQVEKPRPSDKGQLDFFG
ncbi:PA0069 family radical SAM protein [Cellvibrio japonicus]|nr:PA0069 family radical SAM protein [Cellvibrio japonicus]QEI13902.1 PA0069 family radical SAM protein [Cellvibrio japonicus]QEI17476.1 PA0069 family radical SAM protein [Cellvibrio japonicus]QEI21052.1 PA0069 family radical SAM protein [Cellvibrio japonicus]